MFVVCCLLFVVINKQWVTRFANILILYLQLFVKKYKLYFSNLLLSTYNKPHTTNKPILAKYN